MNQFQEKIQKAIRKNVLLDLKDNQDNEEVKKIKNGMSIKGHTHIRVKCRICKRITYRWTKKPHKSPLTICAYCPNRSEYLLIKLLRRLKFKYKYNGNNCWRGFYPDFINYQSKRIIELYGDYFHNRIDRIKKDKITISDYKTRGYKTMVIWEHELKNRKELIKKIKEFHIK